MKRFFVFLALAGVLVCSVQAAEDGPGALLKRQDGQTFRVFLRDCTDATLSVRLDKAVAGSEFKRTDVKFLEFSHVPYDLDKVRTLQDTALYSEVVSALEPVMLPYMNYMAISNNLEETGCLLLDAYFRSGNPEKTKNLAARLLRNENPAVQSKALTYLGLSAVAEGDLISAEAVFQRITDPAAQLYLKALIEKGQNKPKDAIQTIVRLIAEQPNDKEWLPSAELMGAELYKEMGMTNAAAVTARQVEKLYSGTGIEQEAKQLRSKLEK